MQNLCHTWPQRDVRAFPKFAVWESLFPVPFSLTQGVFVEYQALCYEELKVGHLSPHGHGTQWAPDTYIHQAVHTQSRGSDRMAEGMTCTDWSLGEAPSSLYLIAFPADALLLKSHFLSRWALHLLWMQRHSEHWVYFSTEVDFSLCSSLERVCDRIFHSFPNFYFFAFPPFLSPFSLPFLLPYSVPQGLWAGFWTKSAPDLRRKERPFRGLVGKV